MSVPKLTNEEAHRLLEMTKRSLVAEVGFPSCGGEEEFDVIGDTKKDVFAVKIYRGRIKPFKYNIGARIRKNGTMLLELHINPTTIHYNPDGKKICGSHWYIYTEEYGRGYAFPAEDIREDTFVENTIAFLTKFNVVEQPQINYQLEVL